MKTLRILMLGLIAIVPAHAADNEATSVCGNTDPRFFSVGVVTRCIAEHFAAEKKWPTTRSEIEAQAERFMPKGAAVEMFRSVYRIELTKKGADLVVFCLDILGGKMVILSPQATADEIIRAVKLGTPKRPNQTSEPTRGMGP